MAPELRRINEIFALLPGRDKRDTPAIHVIERHIHFALFTFNITLALHRQRPVAVILALLRRLRPREEVADVGLRTPHEPHRAEDAGEAEHVLILEVRAVAVAVHLQRHRVLAGLHYVRHVVLGGAAAVLGEADVLPVHPQVVEGIDAVELEEHAVALPRRGQLKVPAVRAHGIARIVVGEVLRRLVHHVRRIHFERIADVRVERGAPAALAVRAVGLPRTRHLDRLPARDIIIQLLEADRTQRGLLHPLELPRRVGVEANLPIRLPREDFKRGAFVRERRERRARLLAPETHAREILPFIAVDAALFRKNGAQRRSGQNKC